MKFVGQRKTMFMVLRVAFTASLVTAWSEMQWCNFYLLVCLDILGNRAS